MRSVGATMKGKLPPAGRSPKATNWSSFADATITSRDPGQWPTLLQRAWALRSGPTEPLPLAPDNIRSVGSRASQYSS